MQRSSPGLGAKIYAFPKGGRAGLLGSRDAEPRRDEIDPRWLPKFDYSSSWYHDEAVKESTQNSKR